MTKKVYGSNIVSKLVMVLRKRGHNLEKTLDDYKLDLVNLFVFNFLFKEKNYKEHFVEIVNNLFRNLIFS
jgi:hypothetical protein